MLVSVLNSRLESLQELGVQLALDRGHLVFEQNLSTSRIASATDLASRRQTYLVIR